MRWFWQKPQSVPVPEQSVAVEAPILNALDVEAIARSAAEQAARSVGEEIVRAMVTSSPMVGGPQQMQGSKYGLYAYDNPLWYNTPHAPTRRPGSPVTIQTLRNLADNYDILRDCIQHLKDEVTSVPLRFVAKQSNDADKGAMKARIAEAELFFTMSGGLGGPGKTRSMFECELFEDISVVGAGAIFYHPDRGGRPYTVECIDAATIRPVVDAFGWPGEGSDVFEQWILGMKIAGFTREQMSYMGLAKNSRSWTPYYVGPVENLIRVIGNALRADMWNEAWLTDGNAATSMIALPESWTPDQVMGFAQYWDAMLAGDSKARQKTKFVPGGSQKVGNDSRKDQDFQEYELWLMRRTCAAMGVQPASVGFAGEQYKVSQEDSMESTSNFGAGALLEHRKMIYDDLLVRLGYSDLECQNVVAREEKATERATRNVALVAGGIKTPNEARQEEGLDPIADGDVLLVGGMMKTMDQVINPPDPVAPTGTAPSATGGKPAAASDKKKQTKRALDQWERKALNRLRAEKSPVCDFLSEGAIPAEVFRFVTERLHKGMSPEAVRAVFLKASDMGTEQATELTDWSARVAMELEALANADPA